jgi:uncharacterized OsmC-like protein
MGTPDRGQPGHRAHECTTKYVVSRTLEDADAWQNSVLLRGDAARIVNGPAKSPTAVSTNWTRPSETVTIGRHGCGLAVRDGRPALPHRLRLSAHGGRVGLTAVVGRERKSAMDTDELREKQEPLKERYRAEPSAAVITLHAEGSLADSGVICSVQTGHALVEAGLHPATGGDGTFACSGDMLLQALVACAGVTLRAVATSMGLEVAGSVHAAGDLDFRGTLGVDKEAPVGFRDIRLAFDLDTSADPDQVATLLKLTERYCVVLQTLKHSPATSVTLECGAGAGAVG